MVYMIMGIGLLVVATAAFIGIEIILRHRKRQIKERTYQMYE